MKDCTFCDIEAQRNDDGIPYETDDFLIIVGVSLIYSGHTLLIPKQHYKCFGALPDSFDERCVELEDVITKRITEKFYKPFLIEHGVWGQTIPHAHEHFIPSYGISSLIDEMIMQGPLANNVEEADRKRLKQVYQEEGSYLRIEENGKLYICHVTDIPVDKTDPNLTFRAFYEQIKGLTGSGNWKTMTDAEKEADKEKRATTILALANLF